MPMDNQPARAVAKARLYVDADLHVDAAVVTDAAQNHYLRHVMRLADGAPVDLFNGRDGEWRAALAAGPKRLDRLDVAAMMRPQRPEPGPWLAFAPVKRARTDYLVEKATELGVSALCPMTTRRTSVARVNLKRLRAHAVDAAEQCGRLTVPPISPPKTLFETLASWPHHRFLIWADESGSGAPAKTLLPAMVGSNVGIVIGPEGGFSDDERMALAAVPGSCALSLGPRILRTETAALAALSSWQAFCGDWRPAA